MEKISSQILQNLGQHLTPILATAGASGALGGYLTSQTPQRAGETPGQRRMRIIRNALLAGGMGGGAMAAGESIGNQFGNALPADDVDPITKSVTSPLARLGYGTGAFSMLGKATQGTDTAGIQKDLKAMLTKGNGGGLGRAAKDALGLPGGIEGAMKNTQHAADIRAALTGKGTTRQPGLFGGGNADPAALTKRYLTAAGLPAEQSAGMDMAGVRNLGRSALFKTTGLAGVGAKDFGAAAEGFTGAAGKGVLPPIARTALSLGAGMYGPQLAGDAIGGVRDYFTGQSS